MVDDDSEVEQVQTSLGTIFHAENPSQESEDSDTTHTQDSLEQLLNAKTLEFEIRKEVPGSTISGECQWTPV